MQLEYVDGCRSLCDVPGAVPLGPVRSGSWCGPPVSIPSTWKIMRGFMREMIPLTLPAGLGSDVAGVVDQVGAGVTEFQVGDEVMGRSLTPAISESALGDTGPAPIAETRGHRLGRGRQRGRRGRHRVGRA